MQGQPFVLAASDTVSLHNRLMWKLDEGIDNPTQESGIKISTLMDEMAQHMEAVDKLGTNRSTMQRGVDCKQCKCQVQYF